MALKYRVIRYYYTSMYAISLEGGAFFKPIAFDYPDDAYAYTEIANNIMLGDALKLSIQVSDLTKTQTNYYFPVGRWCEIFPSPTSATNDCFTSAGGHSVQFASTLSDF